MPTFDKNLMLRTTGNLTQDETLGPVTVYGGQADGLAVRVVVPSANGINDTVWTKVYASTDNSTYNLIAQGAKGAQKPGTGSLDLITPFNVPAGKYYIEVVLDGTAASTTFNFGAVVAGIVENPGHAQNRSGGSEFR